MSVGVRGRRGRIALVTAMIVGSATALAMPRVSLAAASPASSQNIYPSEAFSSACGERPFDSGSCIQRAVQAIDAARSTESMRHAALVLPDNFRNLDPAEQTFVVIDLERVDRGLRPLAGLVAQLDDDARSAASKQVDPTPATNHLEALGVSRYRTLWAGSLGPLVSDYLWMYEDGYSAAGSPNVDCTSPRAAGCWAHRRAILATFDGRLRLFAGAASVAAPQGFDSITAILAGGDASAPHYVYTWREALRHGADGKPGG